MTDRLPPSLAARLAALSADERQRIVEHLGDDARFLNSWQVWARPDQMPPEGAWDTWCLLGGRGSGKTRAASEDICARAEAGTYRNMGIVGPTEEACRKVCVEGESGILSCASLEFRPVYESSLGRITWPNGCIAHLFSGEEPQRLRGYNFDYAWIDELCAIATEAIARSTWDMLGMAVRIQGPKGDQPRIVITTTPKPWKLLLEILDQPGTIRTTARMIDNIANLSRQRVARLVQSYGGTTLGRQELDAEILWDLEGALWTRELIDKCRVPAVPGLMGRIVIGVDPSGGGPGETGIVIAGLGRETPPHAYILADLSVKGSPQRWALRIAEAYHQFRADRVIVEKNFGGDMVEATIRQVVDHGAAIPIKMVQASRGKAIRAEPVVALYEQNRVHHVGVYPVLEDQLATWIPGGGGASPDRLDALTWAVTELLVETVPVNLEVWLRCAGLWEGPMEPANYAAPAGRVVQ